MGRGRPGRVHGFRQTTAPPDGVNPSTPSLPNTAPQSPAQTEHLKKGAEAARTELCPRHLCRLPATNPRGWSGSGCGCREEGRATAPQAGVWPGFWW